jgi:hypothetical protein
MTERLSIDLSDMAEEPSRPIRVTLKPSHRANVLAAVTVELETDLGTVTISDGRILRNRSGVPWFSMPTYSVTKGREFEYFPTVELSPSLHRLVAEKALAEFEQWEKRGHDNR